MMQHDNAIGVLNGGKAMDDDDGGPSSQEFFEGIADEQLCFRVDAGRRLGSQERQLRRTRIPL